MTFDELFQYYANMGITARPQGIETVAPIQNIQQPIIPIQQQVYQDTDDDNNTFQNTYDPNMGKGFYDYEAAAYGIGSTLPGTVARIATGLMSLPTPLNLARQYFEGRAAEQAAQQQALEQMAAAKRNIQQFTSGPYTGGQSEDKGSSGGAHGMAGRAAGGWQDL